MAIGIVPARELGQQRKLVLQPVCWVHGHCLLEGMTEAEEIRPSLKTPNGATIASVTARTDVTPDGLRVDFQLRLPQGDYLLETRNSSHHSGFTIPFTISKGEADLDLGTKAVPATGPVVQRETSARAGSSMATRRAGDLGATAWEGRRTRFLGNLVRSMRR